MIKDIVEGLIELSGTKNPFEISDYLDIVVLIHDLGYEVSGLFQKTTDGNEVIHINNRLTEHKQRYVCAHELGHAILEPDLSISFFIENPLLVKSKSEIKADKFAAYLLVEDDILHRSEYENLTLEQIATAENIDVELIKLKFNIK